jgi:predicted phage tail protein
MKRLDLVQGAGGGGKGGGGGASVAASAPASAPPRASIEAPDSLRSKQYARVLDLVSEGEIYGLARGLQSVYLDGTPIQNADGTYNATDVTVVTRNGTQEQTYIAGLDAAEAENSVGVPVKYNLPVVRTVSAPNTNAIRVTVSVDALRSQDPTTGDTSGTSVQLLVDVQTAGGGFVTYINDVISGKTSTRNQRSYRIPLSGTGPWDVRVSRVTADSTTDLLQNATNWDSFTTIVDAKLKYPNSALIGLSIDAERFNAIPLRGYELLGLLVKVPSNYNAFTRTYTGVWDGTFTISWTNNPAWCFYDLLTSVRYGLGAFVVPAQIDKWSLYQIAQYCDQLVDNGFGGLEPRFLCNLYLQTQEEAYTVINTFAAIFCGMAYWAAGSIFTSQDAPSNPVALFTEANVVSADTGPFSYSGSSIKTRHTVALVSWNDPIDQYKSKIEYVEDSAGITLYGIIQTDVVASGCTSRGQAHRFGRRLLYTERMETEVVSFRTGLDGLGIAPGQVIQTTHSTRAGVRMGGRLVSATANTITLDAPVTLLAGAVYTLQVMLPDGTVGSATVTTAAGTGAVLTVSPAYPLAPQAMAVWTLGTPNLIPESWRVVSVTEADSVYADIVALAYRADKYAAIEQGLILEPLKTSSLTIFPLPPTNMVVGESLYLVNPTLVSTRITVSWTSSAKYFELQYRVKDGNWAVVPSSTASVDIDGASAGAYEFILTAINALGLRSTSVPFTAEIVGKSKVPVDVTNFTVAKINGVAQLAWHAHPDLDVQVGGSIVIRFNPALSGVGWNDGYVLDQFPGALISGQVPLMTGTYMAKALDSSGNWSNGAQLFVATEGIVTGWTTVGTSTQAPTFAGAKTNIALVGSEILLPGVANIDDMLINIDSWGVLDALGGTQPIGSYFFDTVLDFGSVATRRIDTFITTRSFDTGDFVDTYVDLIDLWDAIDGGIINDCDINLYAATTQTDPAASPVWGAWTPFFVADFTMRAMKFRLDLLSGQSTHNIAVSQLTVRGRIPA